MLLESIWNRDRKDQIASERIYLRSPVLEDWEQWSSLRSISRQHLIPWEPKWTADSLTKRSFKNRLRRYAADARADSGYAFFIFRNQDHQLIGSITLSNIRRGVAQTGTIGYWTGLPFARKGYMHEGLTALIPVLFDHYSLRRLEAACLPENIPSATLLEKVGFTKEGYAREYLCINGKWHDHLLFAMIKGDAVLKRIQPSNNS
ncbi:GNAT family N-acetyltransferase [Sneathiella glossodoripedis]|uniref:GNAT family N-acetyltransferase n=1 Tax=Sneathiella glossodoripedis TaxID=418853 RepID=UPI000471DB6D|nr:GNAT family protein [Sneathiella glossodoripedis]